MRRTPVRGEWLLGAAAAAEDDDDGEGASVSVEAPPTTDNEGVDKCPASEEFRLGDTGRLRDAAPAGTVASDDEE